MLVSYAVKAGKQMVQEAASSSLDVGMGHFYLCVIAIVCLLVVNNTIGRDLCLVV